MTITNEDGEIFGLICGEQRDIHIIVTGYQARITFHSDSRIEKTGFLLFFTAVPHRGEYNHNMLLGISMVVDGKDRIVLSLSQLHKKDQLRSLNGQESNLERFLIIRKSFMGVVMVAFLKRITENHDFELFPGSEENFVFLLFV